MATTPKTTIGTIDCLCCGHEIPVKQSENGTVNAACNWCDFPAYAKKGTQAHTIIMGRLKNQPKKNEEVPKKVAPGGNSPPPPPPPAPRRASIFDLGSKTA